MINNSVMKHFSVGIIQHFDGTATVAFTSPAGHVYRTVVSVDRAVLASTYLIGWDRDGLLFDEDGDVTRGARADFVKVACMCGAVGGVVMVRCLV